MVEPELGRLAQLKLAPPQRIVAFAQSRCLRSSSTSLGRVAVL